MGTKLHKEKSERSIPVRKMKDGEIGVIVEWSILEYLGRIVQRYKNHLLTVGGDPGSGWGEIFDKNGIGDFSNCRVRILQPGELIEIT